MSRTCFKENSFDIIVCVEGLEHVEEDELFIKNVYRILKIGGLLLMTTPHGDCVPNRIPDNKRHYSKAQLYALLHKYFDSVETWGDVRGDRFHRWGLREWSLRHPYWILKSMIGNLLNCYQPIKNKRQEYKTQYLFARCQKGRKISWQVVIKTNLEAPLFERGSFLRCKKAQQAVVLEGTQMGLLWTAKMIDLFLVLFQPDSSVGKIPRS